MGVEMAGASDGRCSEQPASSVAASVFCKATLKSAANPAGCRAQGGNSKLSDETEQLSALAPADFASQDAQSLRPMSHQPFFFCFADQNVSAPGSTSTPKIQIPEAKFHRSDEINPGQRIVKHERRCGSKRVLHNL
eukprot:s7375_g2.t1